MVGFLIALYWNLRSRIWFWIAIIIIAALHVPLIMFIPWTTKWVPAFAIAAIDSADFCIFVAVLLVARKFMDGPISSER